MYTSIIITGAVASRRSVILSPGLAGHGTRKRRTVGIGIAIGAHERISVSLSEFKAHVDVVGNFINKAHRGSLRVEINSLRIHHGIRSMILCFINRTVYRKAVIHFIKCASVNSEKVAGIH